MFFTTEKIILLQNSWAISSNSLRQTVGIYMYHIPLKETLLMVSFTCTIVTFVCPGRYILSCFNLCTRAIISLQWPAIHHCPQGGGIDLLSYQIALYVLDNQKKNLTFYEDSLRASFHAPLSSIFADQYLIVRRSHPASSVICPRFLNDAPMTTVL